MGVLGGREHEEGERDGRAGAHARLRLPHPCDRSQAHQAVVVERVADLCFAHGRIHGTLGWDERHVAKQWFEGLEEGTLGVCV